MILMDGGILNINKEFIKVDFFAYPSFRKRFMKVLLDMLENDIGKENFHTMKNSMYLEHNKGFYVYAPKSIFKSYTDLIKYVCRYVARPVMAESRIIDCDDTFVTFWYQRHEDDIIIIEKIHACEFISRLIIHIPDKNFKQIRYYGAYHNSTKILIDIVPLIPKDRMPFKHSLTKWRLLSIISFKKDPLDCPICQNTMLYYNSVFT